mmetsp:Transcript_65486/g.58765  ORF Transcript_65486/g.58765 Transcript_65486/m.58765 type:complete len:294 (+) Transcript_65486:42-923(+)
MDDFEFVDNDKSTFDELVDDDDTLLLNDDGFGAISDLNKEMKEVQELKKHLKSQCIESSKLLKKLKEQSESNNQLQLTLKQELKQVSDLKLNLNEEKQSFISKKQELNKLLESMNNVPSNITKSQSLCQQLNKFYNDTSLIEQELTKLKHLRTQQEEMINQCKVNIETVNSNQRDCLMSLEKSKSFSCKECGTDIGLKDDIESKCYQVGQGQFTEKKRGYLFGNAVNMVLGATKTENFTTGSYQISWASCAKCNTQMGWKYISADNPNNTQKVGKYCLARYSLSSPEDRAQQK